MINGNIGMIVIHHSGASDNQTADVIRNYHIRTLGWNDIGYHYLINRSGRIRLGRPDNVVGAHVKGKNLGSIGICVIGTFTNSRLSDNQARTLQLLLEDLVYRYPEAKVVGHKELASTECPGEGIMNWLATWKGSGHGERKDC